MRKYENLIGQKFGRLLVTGEASWYVYPSGKRRRQWTCLCDCGNVVCVEHTNLKSGNSKSCGCLNQELRTKRSITHGGRHSKLYRVWSNMKDRCYNPNDSSFKDYGGRGITICDEWNSSFACFREWAYSNGYDEAAPYGKCTIDRIDVNSGYAPSNCRWVDVKAQANNRRNTLFYTFDGETHTLSEWSAITGVKYHTLFARINRLGWTIEKALSTA